MKASESASHAEADIRRNKVIYSITSSARARRVGDWLNAPRKQTSESCNVMYALGQQVTLTKDE
jgi:hypothetical protein